MTDLPDELREVMEQIAPKHDGSKFSMTRADEWRKGWIACYQHLQQSVPEFDYITVTKYARDERSRRSSHDANNFADGAKWQWDSARTQIACCLVRIGGLETRLDSALAERDAARAKFGSSNKK